MWPRGTSLPLTLALYGKQALLLASQETAAHLFLPLEARPSPVNHSRGLQIPGPTLQLVVAVTGECSILLFISKCYER